MRRVIEATHHQARWWNLRRSHRQGQPTQAVGDELGEGLIAYADEHASMEMSIANSFEAKWAVVRGKAHVYLNKAQASDGQDSDSQSQQVEVVQVEIEVSSEVEESGSEDEGR